MLGQMGGFPIMLAGSRGLTARRVGRERCWHLRCLLTYRLRNSGNARLCACAGEVVPYVAHQYRGPRDGSVRAPAFPLLISSVAYSLPSYVKRLRQDVATLLKSLLRESATIAFVIYSLDHLSLSQRYWTPHLEYVLVGFSLGLWVKSLISTDGLVVQLRG